ncbi:MAG TPA: hypothetical protein PKI05_15955, partial [Thermogutta sp.]|nr:hypothetical protein [Thermogutta sp.]
TAGGEQRDTNQNGADHDTACHGYISSGWEGPTETSYLPKLRDAFLSPWDHRGKSETYLTHSVNTLVQFRTFSTVMLSHLMKDLEVGLLGRFVGGNFT